MISREKALALLGSPALLDKIIAANTALKKSKYPPQPVMDLLFEKDPSLYLFRQQNREFYLFDGEGERLALCDKTELERLSLYLGASLHAAAIASLVLRPHKKLILEAIGAEVYRFVMDYARFAMAGAVSLPVSLEQSAAELASVFRKEGGLLLYGLAQSFAHPEIQAFFCGHLASAELPDSPVKTTLSKARLLNLSREALRREDPRWMQYLS